MLVGARLWDPFPQRLLECRTVFPWAGLFDGEPSGAPELTI